MGIIWPWPSPASRTEFEPIVPSSSSMGNRTAGRGAAIFLAEPWDEGFVFNGNNLRVAYGPKVRVVCGIGVERPGRWARLWLTRRRGTC